MNPPIARDRERLAAFFRRELAPHSYAIAALDDFFWPTTTAWALTEAAAREPTESRESSPPDPLAAVVLLIEQLSPPILYTLSPGAQDATTALLSQLLPALPSTFFFNVDAAHLELLQRTHPLRPDIGGEFQKMVLDAAPPPSPDRAEQACEVLRDPIELRDFYANHAYGRGENDERFWEPYMLEMEPYVGVRDGKRGPLVAVGGVHLVSETYGVAALGNIATRPDARGRGHCRAIVRCLCRSLLRRVDCITLNVAVDNTAAIRSYRAAGFRTIYRYVEGLADSAAK